MNIIFILTSIAFFIWVVRNSLFWVYLWQIKEYRFDRLFAHFKETNVGRETVLSFMSIAKWILLLAYFVFINNDSLYVYRLLVFFLFLLEAGVALKELFSHRLRRPVVTPKSILILLGSLFFISVLFALPLTEQFLWLLILDRTVVLLVTLFVFMLRVPTEFYLDFETEQAVKKIQSRKDLLVIGITGSYGKSTTKEYLSQILEKKFTVLKTKGTNNTLIGVVKTILSGLKKDTEIFVAEMGAYKKNEIASIASVINPKIGIITGIANQHLSLFGSKNNLMEAKYELIRSLPKNGLALFNGASPGSLDLYRRTKKKKVLYSVLNVKERESGKIYARNVSVRKDGVSFKVFLDNMVITMRSPVIGGQNAEGILPGIYIAYYLGFKPKEIQKAVGSLVSLPKTMARHKVKNGLTIIDDSFNASPMSISSAVKYMALFRGVKAMILSPMIELGKDAKKEHYNAGYIIGKACNFLFLTDKNYTGDIVRGVKDSGAGCVVNVAGQEKINEFLKTFLNKDKAMEDIILFEGKGAGFILDRFL
ncbi:MAG: UDP-N-acetylmuramoyl-tripeptide--D-alanyl-D-alanine ligase [Patescibacteria group bacterium]|nr:UDP-N-acetylmuramoyl-tripeptide--D-alanyl-D-alanine ligase [Patescibacteria group bacterium]